MQIIDIRSHAPEETLQADVCIVGSGPAGLTLAAELAGTGIRVLLLESGGRERTDDADALDEIESTGAARVMEQWQVRNRVLGGTSTTWSGRVAAFDDVDFAVRPWVPHSGWPLTRADLRPYYERSLAHLGSAVPDNNDDDVTDAVAPRWAGLDPSLFRPYAWTYSVGLPADGTEPRRWARSVLATGLDGVTCLVHATVVRLEPDTAGARLSRVEVAAPDGTRRWVEAPHVVLAAGAIENARLMLDSDTVVPGGVGNGNDLVGRFLMDHLRGAVGHYAKADQYRVQRMFRDARLPTTSGPATLTAGVALTPEVQRDEELLNAALFVHNGDIDTDDPLRAVKDLARRNQPGQAVRTLLRHPDVLADNLRQRLVHREVARLRARTEITLQCMIEQRPDPDSRITLSQRTGALGSRLPVLHWQISDQEARTVRFTVTRFVAESARLGLPVPVLDPMVTDDTAPFHMTDVSHPTGTTRMSVDPRTGVVDTDCAVHGMAGLYVCGSSVFPTAGHANPTQTIVALAVRLADHLKARVTEHA